MQKDTEAFRPRGRNCGLLGYQMLCLRAPQGSLATGLFSRTNQICHSREVCSVASEGEATELPPILDCGQHAVVIVGNVRGTGRMIGVGDREHHDASATRDGIAATCAYRKCYPVRMPLKSATYKKPKTEASPVRGLECNTVTWR